MCLLPDCNSANLLLRLGKTHMATVVSPPTSALPQNVVSQAAQDNAMFPEGETIPVIDLSQVEASAAQAVRAACLKHGFFKIANHPISEELIDKVMALNHDFFELPTEEKMKIHADENFRGYTPHKEETLDAKGATQGDSKEGLYFGREVPKDDPESELPLTGPNQWPSEELLPGYRAATEEYMARMLELGMRIMRLLALALELPADFFDDKFTKPMLFLRPLHYTPEPSDPSRGIFGAGAHSDYGLITILKTDLTGGLQINLDGNWISIPPSEHFIVNLGDMLERWANGLFKSTVHRVLTSGESHRYSMPFFFEPNFDTKVECLPNCCGPNNPPRYPPTTSGQHIIDKYKETHADYSEA